MTTPNDAEKAAQIADNEGRSNAEEMEAQIEAIGKGGGDV